MENVATAGPVPRTAKVKDLINSFGPGIMMATASVGGSHLVASTKAGAIYGWQLAAIILLVNLFKYPFFRAAVQYTMGTGKSLIEGYSDMGRGYLWVYAILMTIATIVSIAALLMFSASLLSYFSPFELSMTANAGIILVICLAILFAGQYKALDTISKVIMLILVVATVTAAIVAFGNGAVAPAEFEPPTIWDMSAIGFIVIMMGWMPGPIEVSTLTSMWLKNQRKEQTVTDKSAMFDFNVGYIGTALLAVVFLALGALVLNGNGETLSNSGIGFSHQLVSMYAITIGEWSRYLIAVVAFLCIFGSTITVIDGYCRSLSEAHLLIVRKELGQTKYHNGCMAVCSAIAMVILLFFTAQLMTMLNFAMILAFITTPAFAYLNYRLIIKANLTGALALGPRMKALSWLGLIYLFGFLAVFIWWKWLI
ncbi:NRAMP family divalent metal transporter [Psychromonas sp. PT13]|uniref:NRAMP family divalent metal transporter n=1 Tax=Psychromonas sp. PT13 TaxID=3439547 RepID=UPI003EBED91F